MFSFERNKILTKYFKTRSSFFYYTVFQYQNEEWVKISPVYIIYKEMENIRNVNCLIKNMSQFISWVTLSVTGKILNLSFLHRKTLLNHTTIDLFTSIFFYFIT